MKCQGLGNVLHTHIFIHNVTQFLSNLGEVSYLQPKKKAQRAQIMSNYCNLKYFLNDIYIGQNLSIIFRYFFLDSPFKIQTCGYITKNTLSFQEKKTT